MQYVTVTLCDAQECEQRHVRSWHDACQLDQSSVSSVLQSC